MLAHWIWLANRPGIGCRRALDLLSRFPDIETLYFAGSYDGLEGLEQKHCEALEDKSLEQAQHILEQCQRKGIQILTYQDSAYPARLRQIPDPPLVLYYKGTLPEFDGEAAIGVVGTRKVSAYGCLVAKRLGYQITKCGGLVVSGLADGTDTMAMRGALMADGKTVGVLDSVTPPLSNLVIDNRFSTMRISQSASCWMSPASSTTCSRVIWLPLSAIAELAP